MPITLALTGDSIVQRRLLTKTDPVLLPLFEKIRAADISFTNLEVLPNDYRGDPALESGGSHFGAPAWVVDELTEAGFDLFAFATNHCLDYGVSGLLASIENLEKRQVSWAGVGRNLEDAQRPTYHTHPNGTVAMISCSATFAKGQEASAQRPDMPGRPGLAPLRHDTVYEITAPQMAVVKEMAEHLGLEAKRKTMLQMGFGAHPGDESVYSFGDMQFRVAETPGVKVTARAKDVDAMAHWVREARLSADLVMVSFHAHEQGTDKETPSMFLPAFARRMIDEGADMVVGHGPHLLRGMEIYQGKPIFYSLGNFFGQNELVPRLPSDSYDRFRADPSLKPGEVYRKRTNNDQRGFPSDRKYWESVVPFCVFDDRQLVSIEIQPVGLGLGEKAHSRGRPRLAVGDEAQSILARFASLSAPFGTSLDIDGDVARVRL